MPNYSWPSPEKRRVMGKRMSRLDGPAKASGRAKYPSDVNRPGLLHAVLLTSPHAHAKVTSIDTSAAEKMRGVAAVRVISGPGTEIQWAGTEVAVVAAETEQIARDAVRAINVQYEVMNDHVVREEDLSKVGSRATPAGEKVTGDPDKAFKEAEVVSEGQYGIPVITHCCLEPHGNAIEWKGDKIEYWPSTQAVSTIAGDLAKQLQLPATQIHVSMDYMGGGFGSKFPSDRWGSESARISQSSGKAVKLFLDRATELTIGGVRPSAFAKIKIGATKDGRITSWESQSWATGGMGGGGMPPIPYVLINIPNQRLNHSAVRLNAGPARAWRAPNHPQASFLTCSAIEDLAAKLKLDPLEVFMKNVEYSARPEVYKQQLAKAAELIEWKKRWHQRGDTTRGPIKRGLGIGINTWGGGGHASRCRARINPDGTVEVELGSQDIGTATRTMIAMVAAETWGLPVSAIQVKLGDNQFPPSGPSGGSTTIGGVTTSTRKATVNALDKLFEAVAKALDTTPDQLEAVDGKIQVKGNPAKSLTWKAACQKLGVKSIEEMGENDPKLAPKEGLNTLGVGGIQMADVSVDIETGVVKMNKLVAVQDMGLCVNPKTAESQIFGACIMSVCAAIMEERVMDQQIGRVLNADMEFYKLAGAGDIGEVIVHINTEPEHDKRGVIGLGEPCAIGGIAAIGNAVANAIGVRVPEVPLTPRRVLNALQGRNA
jgi:xanthine dehydrogenase YagR molybdenum-binding subunit